MQGGQRSNGRRPHYGGGGNSGRYGGASRGPYDRPQGAPRESIPRIRSVKEAMETSVLLTMPQYLSLEDVSLSTASDESKSQAFQAYTENHRRAALERFFLGHKDEAWFRDRYVGDEFEGERALVREAYTRFLADYKEGKFGDLKLDFVPEEMNLENSSNESSGVKNIPLSAPLPASIAPAALERFGDLLTIGNIPPTVPKASLSSLLRDSSDDSLLHLHLSEPVYEKNLYRTGFALFREGTDLHSLALKLDTVLVEGCKIFYSVHKSFTRQIRLAPAKHSEPEQMAKDLELSKRLLEALCVRYELDPVPWTFDDIPRSLDLNITCFRLVFSLCFYSGTKCSDVLELQKNCGDFVLRSFESEELGCEALSIKIEDLIRLYGPPFSLATEDNIIESKYVSKLDESRYRCSVCSKLFKGPEFVIKHIRLKHEEESASALHQLAHLNLFLSRPSPCAFLKSSLPRKTSSPSSAAPQPPRTRQSQERPPPPDADTRVARRGVKQYTDWDAPAAGEVEINYD